MKDGKSHVACFKCGRTAKPKDNDEGSNALVKTCFALSCPHIPEEMNPLGIGGKMLCPMAAAR